MNARVRVVIAGALALGLVATGLFTAISPAVAADPTPSPTLASCGITTASAGGQLGTLGTNGYAHSVTFTTPMIMNSTPGSAPFSFTVLNAGSIPDVLTVATSPVSDPFSIIGAPFAAVPLAAGASNVYDTGVSWTELGMGDFYTEFTVTWTVSCGGNQ